MRLKPTLPVIAAVAAVAVGGGAATAVAVNQSSDERSAALAEAIDSSVPRNVILLIGDGTDDSIITAARNYELGANGRFAGIDALPFTGAMTTHGLKVGKKQNGEYPIAYVSDSAPTASGWSTGRKTVDSRLSQGPSEADTEPGEDYPTLLEIFRERGKRTGNVTTSAITDASPAAAASHINLRACQGPENMASCTSAQKANGGKGSVAEQLVDNEIDVILGGGRNRYMQNTDAGPTVLEYAQATHGYRDIKTGTELAGVSSLADGPILGLFSGGTEANPKSTSGENMVPLYEALQAQPGGAGSATTRCTVAERGTQPRLADMTRKAIDLLDNDEGFFLQVESAMVDKQEHASDACGAIGDVAELDRAVQVALEYQESNPDTLIIVTGDHSHSTQIVPSSSSGRATATVQTADGDPMTLAYSTNNPGSSQAHTGSQIRIAAKGPQAANVTGVVDQTDIFATALGRTPSEVPGTVTETVTTTVTTEVPVPTPVPGPTVTVPGPATPAPTVPLRTGFAVPARVTNAQARQGIPAAVVATRDGRATVTVKRGSTTLLTTRTTVRANSPKALRLRASKLGRTQTGRITVQVRVEADGESAGRTSRVSVTR